MFPSQLSLPKNSHGCNTRLRYINVFLISKKKKRSECGLRINWDSCSKKICFKSSIHMLQRFLKKDFFYQCQENGLLVLKWTASCWYFAKNESYLVSQDSSRRFSVGATNCDSHCDSCVYLNSILHYACLRGQVKCTLLTSNPIFFVYALNRLKPSANC